MELPGIGLKVQGLGLGVGCRVEALNVVPIILCIL